MSMQIPLKDIRPNLVALRPPQTTEDEYQALKANIAKLGILQPVRVRKKVDPATKADYWELIDGLQRFSIATELNFEMVPCEEATADDMRVLVEQIALNAHRVTTRHASYGQQLQRVLDKDPTLTMAGLAEMTGMSEAWVGQHLSIAKLIEPLRVAVDGGQIRAANAYQLSRLPPEEQPLFADRAATSETVEFAAAVNGRLREIRKARMAGRDPNAEPAEFQPVPLLRKSSEIKDADPTSIVQEAGATNAVEGAAAAIQWALRLNPTAAQEQIERHKVQAAKAQADRTAQRAERAQAAVTKAQQRAAELRQQLGLPPVAEAATAPAA